MKSIKTKTSKIPKMILFIKRRAKRGKPLKISLTSKLLLKEQMMQMLTLNTYTLRTKRQLVTKNFLIMKQVKVKMVLMCQLS